jgi:phosphoglycerate dehydrogenase-like enzyme
MPTRIAILDDYQNVAMQVADWSSLEDCEVLPFNDSTLADNHIDQLRDFEVIVLMRERTPFTSEVFDSLPNLQLLVTTGMQNVVIDLVAANRAGVVVSGTGGIATGTSELTWGLILALLRHIPTEDRNVREGRWQSTLGGDLHGRTLGLIGLGRIGTRVAAVAGAFGMEVIAWSENLTVDEAKERGAVRVDKDELFRRSDLISVHLVLSDRTAGIIGLTDLEKMKASALFVNTSRASLVESGALESVLRGNLISGAATDVYRDEPPSPDDPIRQLPNCVLTPHLGFVTRAGYEVFYGEAVEDIRAWLDGAPIRLLT